MTTTRPATASARTHRTDPVLEVTDLTVRYQTLHGEVQALEGVSFALGRGQSLGLVGESGCGKTTVALSLLQLLPANARVGRGAIRLEGTDLARLTEGGMRRHRWRDLAMVFQGAMNSWNPVYPVAHQIEEALRVHRGRDLPRSEARARIGELFELVGLPRQMMDRYPHEYSGGMRQRAAIAMALSCEPKVIVADEPTTALDVLVQDRILRQLKTIQRELGMSIIYISHDLAVIAEVADRLGVMYAGELVELGPSEEVFARPRHPYSWSLLTSTPSVHGPRRALVPLEGEPPDLLAPPGGCRFHPRCPMATRRCAQTPPALEPVGAGRRAACWHWREVPEPTAGGSLA